MDSANLGRIVRRLRSRLPFVGARLRREACRQLAADRSPDTVPHLCGAMASRDPEVRAIAEAALRSLERQDAVDALCLGWAAGRDRQLGSVVADCGYVASRPVRERVLSALLCNALRGPDVGAEETLVLLEALTDPDAQIGERAEATLRSLTKQEAIDTVCEAAIAEPTALAASIIRGAGYQHSIVSRRCLVYLLTGQIERALDLDFELQYLRSEYEAGDERLKASVTEVVRRSGDTRLAGIILQPVRGTGPIRKRAAELSEREANVVVQVYARHGRWADIFALLPYMPLCAVVPALDAVRQSGWEPEDAAQADLWRELLSLRGAVGEMPEPPLSPEVAAGAVLDRWIAEGRSRAMADLPPEELRRWLQQAPPLEAVGALSALQARGLLSPEDIDAVCAHRHWPVRLAYLELCDATPELAFSGRPVSRVGGGLWIDRWAVGSAPRATRNARALGLTPDRLECLQRALDAGGAQDRAVVALGSILLALARHRLRHTIEIDDELVVAIGDTDIEVDT